jgi:hypothetical protein
LELRRKKKMKRKKKRRPSSVEGSKPTLSALRP